MSAGAPSRKLLIVDVMPPLSDRAESWARQNGLTGENRTYATLSPVDPSVDLILWDVDSRVASPADLNRIQEAYAGVPTILLTRGGGGEIIHLLREGATDCLTKSEGELLPLVLDRALRERKTAREINAREEALKVVSHDLRNTLASVLLVSEIQIERLGENSPGADRVVADALHAFSKIRRSGNSMRSLIDRVLHDDSPLAVVPVEMEVAELVREMREVYEPLARAKGIAFIYESKILRNKVRVDGDRIHQALANLLANAIKFTPPGGKVSVKLASDPSCLWVEVCDSGPGVPESIRSRIFDKYFQGEAKDGRGLGLGLYIARTIIENHGGVLTLGEANEAGMGGAAFRVEIPFTT